MLSHSGFTGTNLRDGRVRLHIVNLRPSVDAATGTYAENLRPLPELTPTIEIFETRGAWLVSGPHTHYCKSSRCHAESCCRRGRSRILFNKRLTANPSQGL